MMQLLPQTKVTEQKKDEREAEVFRRLRVQKANVEAEKDTRESALSVDPERKKILKEFDDFKNDIEKRKSKLLGEILALERRRDTAMEPFYEVKFQALEAMDRASVMESKLKVFAKKLRNERMMIDSEKQSLIVKEEMLSNKEKELISLEISIAERESDLVKKTIKRN